MRFIAITARKDLRRIFRDPVGLIAWISMPLIITGMMTLVFSGDGDPLPQGKLLLVDQDKTLVSGALMSAFNRDPLSKMILVEPVDLQAGRKRLDAGDASALLIIPGGFGRAFFMSQRATLTLLTNPAERILPEMIHQALAIMLDGSFYLQALLGDEFAKYAGGQPADIDVARTSVAVNRMARELSGYLNPPLIELNTTVIQQKQKPVPFPALFYPGMLVLAVFGLAQSMSEDMWRERTFGTLRRALASPQHLALFLAGKIAALWLVFVALAAAGMTLAALLLTTPVNNFAIAVVWVGSCGVALYLLAVLLQLFASEQRTGAVLNAFVLFLLGMVGGTFFPFEMMPPWLAAIGRFTPNGWTITRFKEMIYGSVNISQLVTGMAGLLVFAAIVFLVLVRRLRRWAV